MMKFVQNVRPSADDLPKDVAVIVTLCWKEDPKDRPNFSQIIQMLLCTISPPEPVYTSASRNAVLADDTPKTPIEVEHKQRGLFFCCS